MHLRPSEALTRRSLGGASLGELYGLGDDGAEVRLRAGLGHLRLGLADTFGFVVHGVLFANVDGERDIKLFASLDPVPKIGEASAASVSARATRGSRRILPFSTSTPSGRRPGDMLGSAR